MKVHNLGNDYAHQRKLKQQENQSETKSIELPATPEVTFEANVGDQVQSGGERETVATAEETPYSKQKTKKKKETGAENVQPQD